MTVRWKTCYQHDSEMEDCYQHDSEMEDCYQHDNEDSDVEGEEDDHEEQEEMEEEGQSYDDDSEECGGKDDDDIEDNEDDHYPDTDDDYDSEVEEEYDDEYSEDEQDDEDDTDASLDSSDEEECREKRCCGFFQCPTCRQVWESSYVYCGKEGGILTALYRQDCKKCLVGCLPFKVEPLRCSRCGETDCCQCDKRHIDVRKPHRSDLCHKCLRGHPCT